MVHEIQVAQYKTVPSSIKLGTFDSYGTEKIHFTFGSGWEDLAVYATFTAPNGKSTQTAVDLEGYTDVPAEATAGEAGQGEIVLIGKAEGVNRITVTLHYTVLEHGPVQGAEPAVPTPDLLQQVLTLSKDAQQSAKNAEQSAKNAVKDATDTVKPFKEEAVQAAAGASLSEKSAAESKVAAQKAAEVSVKAGIAAGNAADDAKKAAGTATGAAGSSALNAESAQRSAQNAQQSATDAAESQNAAKASADAAAKSQQSAATEAKTAADAKDAAADSADAAAAGAKAAGRAASAAAGSEQAAGTSEIKAAESEGAAKESEQAAAKSAQAAAESKTAAAESEKNAAASAKKAQGIADSLPADYTTAVGEIAKLKTDKADKTELNTVKQQVESITPDDSTVGEKPWSSKNIVDMLCPPLEESGNPVVCYPVAGYPLGVKASWEPVQEGSGTPYPAGGGKNLFNVNGELICNNGSFSVANNAVTFTDYAGLTNYFPFAGWVDVEKNTDYVVSFKATSINKIYVYTDKLFGTKITVASGYKFNSSDNTRLLIAFYSLASERTGDRETVTGVQVEKGTTATAWEPYENIRPIKGRDSVTVERCGENVIEFLSANDSSENIKIAVDAEKNITLNGALARGGNIIIGKCRLHWVAGKTYTMYIKKVGGSATLGSDDGITFAYSLFTTDYNRYFRGDTNSTNLDAYIANGAALVETELVFMLQCWRANTVFNNFKFQIEIVPGTTAPTTYKPYIGQANTLTLPETVYGGEVDAVRGESGRTWRVIVPDGDKLKFTPNANGTFWNMNSHTAPGVTLFAKIMCSHINGANFSSNTNYEFIFTTQAQMAGLFETADELNAYLAAQYAAGTPVQICYKLAEPVSFTATGAQPIPALSGTNTVLTDADSATVTGRADPIKRITDLEDAVASQT